MKRWHWILVAVIGTFFARLIQEWFRYDRTIVDTFSRWEWAVNFLLMWVVMAIAMSVIFVGFDAVWRKFDKNA